MNPTDLRDVDLDVYRQRAMDLRREAMNRAIDGALAWIRAQFGMPARRAAALPAGSPRKAHCPA